MIDGWLLNLLIIIVKSAVLTVVLLVYLAYR